MTEPASFDLGSRTVWVAGHRGMVGSAIVRRLDQESIAKVVSATSNEVDLTRQSETEEFVLPIFTLD